MADVEKVISALECAIQYGPHYCGGEFGDENEYSRIEQNVLMDALALLKAREPITGETSDGYHTFNELYHHRAVLFSVIVNNYKDLAWKSVRHHDGTMYDGMFIVGIYGNRLMLHCDSRIHRGRERLEVRMVSYMRCLYQKVKKKRIRRSMATGWRYGFMNQRRESHD